MGKPICRKLGTKEEFYWETDHVHVTLDRINEHSDGRITSEAQFKTDLEGIPPHILQTQINLLSSRAKKDLIKDLSERFPSADWFSIIEQLCFYGLQLYREGEPVKEVWGLENVPQPEFLISPLLYKDKPTLLFGEGSSGKSYLALTLALFTQLPYLDNPLGLKPKQAIPLYLDYESDLEDFERRLSSLIKGLGIPNTPILYRESTLPLVEDIDQIQQIVAENNVSFVIIDSLGVASGNNSLNDATTATSFFSALRRLKVTTLILTHVAKDMDTRKTSPFGSVFFINLSRNVFQIQRQQDEGESVINLALFHKKNNQGPLLPPRGFKITFEREKTIIKKQEVEDIPEFMESLSLKSRITALLKEGKASTKDIAEELDTSEASIRKTLNRGKGLFVKVGIDWGLLEKGTDG